MQKNQFLRGANHLYGKVCGAERNASLAISRVELRLYILLPVLDAQNRSRVLAAKICVYLERALTCDNRADGLSGSVSHPSHSHIKVILMAEGQAFLRLAYLYTCGIV